MYRAKAPLVTTARASHAQQAGGGWFCASARTDNAVLGERHLLRREGVGVIHVVADRVGHV